MRKGNSTRVDKGLDPGRWRREGGREGELKRESPGENMLGAALGGENKWAPPTRLLLQNSCEARRESTQSRLKIHNTRARVFNPRRRLPARAARNETEKLHAGVKLLFLSRSPICTCGAEHRQKDGIKS